jgi:hypothetical protein
MSQNRGNSTAFIEAEQYSAFILRNLHDGMLPGTYYRNVSDFGSGTTLNIKTIGSVTIQDGAEEVPFDYSPIESGTITMTISDYVGDAWYVTDELREDGAQVEALMAARSSESTRAIQETFETRFLNKCNTSQVNANANVVNGFAHRIASAVATVGSENTVVLDHLIRMKLAFDKANVPMAGRVFICDPVVGATLDRLVSLGRDVTPFGQKILENGFDRDHQFLMNLYGWNIITSNRLAQGTFSDGTTSVSGAVANVFMSLADDNTKPIMAAWRRMPKVEGERNKDLRRDEFVTSSRWGFGTQRVDTLGILITSATKI